MRFTVALCYIFLTITICLSCVTADEQNVAEESGPDKRIHKRDATVLIETYPFDRNYKKPKMVYRRTSNHHYVQPKLKHGPPRHKYKVEQRRSPAKKFRNKPKHARSHHKNRPPKPRYGPSQKPSLKTLYRPPKQAPAYTYFSPVSSSFGEPPVHDYRPPKYSYAEPPVDSYGDPIKPVYEDTYPIAPSYPTTNGHFDSQDLNYRQEHQSWDFIPGQSADTVYEYSKKVPVVTKPDSPIYVTLPPTNDYDDVNAETEASKPKRNYYVKKEKKRVFSNSKIVKKPWRLQKNPAEADDEIIVGGKYAEPPARFVQKFMPSASIYEDDEENFPRQWFDAVPSATQSPYVNYKNSNMAFSPQNLNDAFSIVDK